MKNKIDKKGIQHLTFATSILVVSIPSTPIVFSLLLTQIVWWPIGYLIYFLLQGITLGRFKKPAAVLVGYGISTLKAYDNLVESGWLSPYCNPSVAILM